MVTRVGKFVGGLGQDITNIANAHATENRIAFGAAMNPTANVHVTGNAHITTTFSTGGNITGGGTYTGGGTMTTGGNIIIPDAGNIGSASDTDAIAISSGGVVAISATTASTGSDDGALTVAGGLGVAGDLGVGDDARFDSDGAVISFGVNDEITLTHVHNTGLLLEDSGGSPTLQLHDANESISSDGSKLILTSSGVAFNFPTSDGSAGQVIKTDGSRTLSFVDVSTTTNPATALASDTDCGALSGATADTTDAFGQATDDALANLDLLVEKQNALGTVDQGALS